jgi:uncharacterized protein
MKTERRFFKAAEVRVSPSGGIAGFAAVFNQLSEDLGGFRERILPGAFSRCLGSGADVRCLFNHNPDALLGRTKSGTLRLSEEPAGLYFDCDLPDTQAGRDVRASIKRGDITQCSFGFTVQGQNWLENGTIRVLADVDLFDVSPVTFAAYPQTSVSARQQITSSALWPDGQPAEIRTRQSTGRKSVSAQSARVASSASSVKGPLAAAMEGKTDTEKLAIIASRLGEPISIGRTSMRAIPYTDAEKRELRNFLETGRYRRDLTAGGAGYGFVAEAFNSHVFEAMKVYDELFDDEVTTRIETDTGAALDLFGIDDTENAATIPGEGVSSGKVDPASLQKLQLADAPTWDTGVVACSLALLQDQKVDLPALLARSFGIRLARGIGKSLLSTLQSSAILGATAAGDPNTDGATGADSIGYGDLVALKGSVNPAYRASSKVYWLMNDDTLTALDSLTDKNGRPIIHPVYVNGRRILLGFPVAISPSLPDIGTGTIPIYFGAFDRFVVRIVATGGKDATNQDNGRLVRLWEAEGYAENLLVGYKSFLRANGGLLDVTDNGSPAAPDAPIKYLQNAA